MVDHVLEKEVPFSESLLWKLQAEAYAGFGISAWSQKGVPTYLTTHPITARGYAKTALGFLKDINNQKPVTFFDIGAGTGRFAYLFLKEILPKLDVPIRYIVTDITEENLRFIREHPLMRGRVEIETRLYRHDDTQWQQPVEHTDGPTIVITNYYFDTVPQMLYRVEDGQLFEGKVTLTVDEEHHTDDAAMIPYLKSTYTYTPIQGNQLLQEYGKILHKGTFIVPTGGLQTIEFIRKQVKGPLLWLMADQGVCTLQQARNFEEPKISKHGTFSVTVSYHFLHWYFQQEFNLETPVSRLKGTVITTDNPDPAYVVMAAILAPGNYPNAAQAFRDTINALEPVDYYKMSEGMIQTPSLETIMALIRIGYWDPVNTYLFYEDIRQKMKEADTNTRARLIYLLERVRDNFYPISKEEGEIVMNLGVLFFELEEYRLALDCFEKTLLYTGPHVQALMNIAICQKKITFRKSG